MQDDTVAKPAVNLSGMPIDPKVKRGLYGAPFGSSECYDSNGIKYTVSGGTVPNDMTGHSTKTKRAELTVVQPDGTITFTELRSTVGIYAVTGLHIRHEDGAYILAGVFYAQNGPPSADNQAPTVMPQEGSISGVSVGAPWVPKS